MSRRRGGRSHRTPYSAGLKSRVGADARFSATTWDSSTMHNSFGKPNLASLRRHRSMKPVLQAFEHPGERQLWGEGRRCRKEPGDLRSHRKGGMKERVQTSERESPIKAFTLSLPAEKSGDSA